MVVIIRKAFKLFRVRKNGSISSLFINKKRILELDKWLEAGEFPTKGFKLRPGWHCTNSPNAPHLSLKNREWYIVLMKDFTVEKRPLSQGGIWYLAKWIKIIKYEKSGKNLSSPK
jgi:hypothetical protein